MELENQVCSLESSKKLKELGVKQESYFIWLDRNIHYYLGKKEVFILAEFRFQTKGFRGVEDNIDYEVQDYPNYYSAFTVAELGEMLPFSIVARYEDGEQFYLYLHQFPAGEYNNMRFEVGYSHKGSIKDHFENAETETEARAKMLIYLIEKGHIKPAEEKI